MGKLGSYRAGAEIKSWQFVIMALLPVVLLVMGACSSDKPYYSADDVISMTKQQLCIVENGSLTQDRYGAELMGQPIVANFRLSDWEAKYVGQGKWLIAADARYYVSIYKQTAEGCWHFYEDSSRISMLELVNKVDFSFVHRIRQRCDSLHRRPLFWMVHGGTKMAYPRIPGDVQEEIDTVAEKYTFYIHTQQYTAAEELATNLYNKMLGWQTQYEKRLHKGYPLHCIGYALDFQSRAEALKYFLLAYIEDLLSVDIDDAADLLPAGQTLLINKEVPDVLKRLKQAVAELKKRGSIPFVPEEVIGELGGAWRDVRARIAAGHRGYRLRKPPVFDPNCKREDRVFIGVSGKLQPTLNYIRDMVTKLGYHPVVPFDFPVPEGMDISRKCSILLLTCKHGIFDLSEETGQLIEIEKLHQYDVQTLLVWPKGKEAEISAMLNGQAKRAVSYERFTELENTFREFLQRNGN
ncbi:hypothetical protein ACFLYF_02835 [Chloroflexota bacterium]